MKSSKLYTIQIVVELSVIARMDSETDIHDFAEEAFELVRSKLINLTFSDYQRTPLFILQPCQRCR